MARLQFDDWCRRSKQNTDSNRHTKSVSISNQSNQRPRRQINNNKYMHMHTNSLTLPSDSAEDFMGLQTIASSPCNSKHSSSVLITPTSSPTKELLLQASANALINTVDDAATRLSLGKQAALSKRRLPANVQVDSSDEEDDAERLADDNVMFSFDADLHDLDLDQIEKF